MIGETPRARLLMERWEEIDTLFSRIIGLPPEERDAFLERSCEGDAELEALLRDLLGGTESTTQGFLASPVDASPIQELFHDEASTGSLTGSRLGPFVLGPMLGKGGLGVVYRADRVEGGFDQSVAVKFVLNATGPDVIRRFERERAILASLDHPNIARLLDAGSTDQGRPFIVMELVDGVPITQYCRSARLEVEARVRLFLKVCDAVASAHQRMVVHRDLKPSNILVTDAGHPKLLDFGIAKLLPREGAAPGESATELTRVGRAAFSPAYASPEQVMGAPVTAASDVFQLGVLLYELLAGIHPFAPPGTSPADLVRRVSEFDPPDPSRATAPDTPDPVVGARRSRSRLRGDLDTIIMKMLRKEPDRRYASVAEVIEDLRRHLDGHPIRARPHGAGYRLSRFVRRNRALSTAVAMGTLVAVVGVGALFAHNERLQQERDRATAEAARAEAEAARAEAATAFLLELFEAAGDSGTRDTMTVGTLLRTGEDRLEAGLVTQPALRIELLGTLASAYQRLGLDGAAMDLDDRRVEAAVAEFGPDDLRTASILLDAGIERSRARHWARASIHLEAALRIQRLHATEPLDEASRRLLGGTLRPLSMVRRELGDTDGALAAAEEAVELMRPIPGRRGEDLASELVTLGLALRGQESYDAAERVYLEAISIHRGLEAPRPVPLAQALLNYSSLLRAMDRPTEADPLLAEAQALVRPLGEDSEALRDAIYISRASLLGSLRRLDDGLDVTREFDARVRAEYPEGHWRVGRSTRMIGEAFIFADDCASAEPYLSRTVSIYTEALGWDHLWTEGSRALLASCLPPLGRSREAADELRVLLPAFIDRENPPEDLVERMLEAKALALDALGRADDAEVYRERLEILRNLGMHALQEAMARPA